MMRAYSRFIGAIELAVAVGICISTQLCISRRRRKKQTSKEQDNWGNKGSIHPVVPLPILPTAGGQNAMQ
jgi:hypothetical protein